MRHNKRNISATTTPGAPAKYTDEVFANIRLLSNTDFIEVPLTTIKQFFDISPGPAVTLDVYVPAAGKKIWLLGMAYSQSVPTLFELYDGATKFAIVEALGGDMVSLPIPFGGVIFDAANNALRAKNLGGAGVRFTGTLFLKEI